MAADAPDPRQQAPRVPGRPRRRGDQLPDQVLRPGAAARADNHVIKLWLMDTGCGHDLVSKKELATAKHLIRSATMPLLFTTANGTTHANEAADLFVKEFGETVRLMRRCCYSSSW